MSGKSGIVAFAFQAFLACTAFAGAEKGLLLVVSEPSGAEITWNGMHLGETPRVIDFLDAGRVHTLELRKTGYRDGSVEVSFNGRTPVVKNVSLVLDAGTLVVTSVPIGAAVTVNGASKGHTPLEIKEVAKGSARVEVSLPGYRTMSRDVTVAVGGKQMVSFELEKTPGNLRLSSVPAGARFYLDGEPYLGDAAGVLKGIAPRVYRVTAKLDGYADAEAEVEVAAGETAAHEFMMEDMRGTFEFKTKPAGADIYVDNVKKGTTRSASVTAEWSDVFVVRDVIAGDREIRVEKRGYNPKTIHLNAKAKEAVQQKVSLKEAFIPDRLIEKDSGEKVRGILVREDGSTVTLQLENGVEQPIPRAAIRKIEAIFPEE
ncbi:MAG: PEGA domain-containing protein [Kiritimatiellae bacterium]|nr:PEGA domain-containing protein [Kiritimatiellia bacterium]